ncbi:MAG TPA: hypothetical protein VLW52_11220 [Opitutaceae bacterium]|nr:hypothetical protein [Opitutaceae bacterium]
MLYLSAAFGLLLHVLFWGAGLALLVMPRPYQRYWAVLIAPAGVALQSAVVWLGACANLPGTDSYARWAVVIPVGILAAALASPRRRRHLWPGLRSVWGVGLAMALALGVIVRPLASASARLTTASLGSCDAADYAAGARVLKEFARSDRTGFIGQTEVVQVQSVDNFYDFWLRLNHFTPSALIAFNASFLRLQPYQLTGLATAVLLVLAMPLVFWLARDGLRLGALASGTVALLYGVGPLNLYAVYHVAMGQLLAASAIALLTWIGVALWREGAVWRRAWAWAGVLFLAYWLVLGSYNFILPVCLVPAVAFAGGLAAWRGMERRFLRWLGLMLAPLAACGLVFGERILGLMERFRLFRQYDFGWRIPAFSPEEWWGMVRGSDLSGYEPRLRLLLSLVLLAALIGALVRGARHRAAAVPLVLCLTVPVFIGYAYLEIRGATRGTNASYDAYKLFSVFYPGILAALCYWFGLGARLKSGAMRLAVVALAALVLAGNAVAVRRFQVRMQNPPLIVDASLIQLQSIERRAEVDSINMLIPDFWSRLWANAFLLRKPQYFTQHTYEGRLNTALRGGWDLLGGVVDVMPSRSRDRIEVNPFYSLVDTRSPDFLRAQFGTGWYEIEQLPENPVRWRWSRGDAEVILDNPHPYPLIARCGLTLRSVVPRDLQAWMQGRMISTQEIGTNLESHWLPEITLSPGRSVMALRSSQPAATPGPGDTRLLGFGVYAFDIHTQREGAASPPAE